MFEIEWKNSEIKLKRKNSSKMHLLRTFGKDLLVIGIGREEAKQKYPFNRRNVLAVLILSLATVSCCLQLIFVANTFIDYTRSFYSASAMGVATLILLRGLLITRPIYHCFKRFKKTINGSESIKRVSSYWTIKRLKCSSFQDLNIQPRKNCTNVLILKLKSYL